MSHESIYLPPAAAGRPVLITPRIWNSMFSLSTMPNRFRHLIVALIMAASFFVTRSGIRDKSPTEDEFAHLTRGIAIWQTGDTKLSYAHPPLANILATAGLADSDRVIDLTTSSGWTTGRVGSVAMSWLRSDYAGARAVLMEARERMTWIFMLGIGYVYFFVLRLFGWRSAVAASTIVAFNPVFIGHARYVTTDLAAAVALSAATGELARHLTGRSPWVTWGSLPITLGLAILTKHSAVLLVPIFVLIVFGATVIGKGPNRDNPWRTRAWKAGIHGGYCSLVVLVLVNAGYGFQDTSLTVKEILDKPEPQYWISSPYKEQMLEEVTPLPGLPSQLRIPVPYTHLFGVGAIRAQNVRGFPSAQFLGKRRPMGHVGYFPTMIATKTPLAILCLLLAGVWRAVAKKHVPSLATLAIVTVTFCFLAAAMRSNLNMGLRHGLFIVWELCILAGVTFGRLWLENPRPWWVRGILGLGVASVVVVGATAGSDHIGYFNAVVGRQRGHYISAIGDDWGQDRAAFAKLVERYELQPLYYDPQTATRRLEIEYLGLKFTNLKCKTKLRKQSWAALHTATWNNHHERCWPQLRGREPVFRVNDHILVFYVPT